MSKLIINVLLIASTILLASCATTYKPIKPKSVNYNSHDIQDNIEFSYKYDVLRDRGNKKYAKKEYKKGVKLVAVKITNHSEKIINVGQDLLFYSGNKQINLIEPMVMKEIIKQIVPAYLPYLFLTILNGTLTKIENGVVTEEKYYPAGFILGPSITAGNMIVAGTANKNMLNELVDNNILYNNIEKGETVYGIIGIQDTDYSHLSLRSRE
jgi:hypothetical protein